MQVNVVPATPETEFIVRNMFLLYFHDLSAFDDGLDSNRFGLPVWAAFGGPTPRTHEACVAHNWWIRDKCDLLHIEADGKPVGFAVVNRGPQFVTEGVDFDLMDFFIVAKHRGQGIGRQAARQVFDRQRGVWEVFQLARNHAALAFWHKVIGEYTGGRFEMSGDGTRQQFDNRTL